MASSPSKRHLYFDQQIPDTEPEDPSRSDVTPARFAGAPPTQEDAYFERLARSRAARRSDERRPAENAVLEAIRARRSVRAFTGDPVPEHRIMDLIQAASWAPSAMNLQPWAFTIIQDRMTLERISDLAATLRSSLPYRGSADVSAIARKFEADIFYGAKTLIVIHAEPTADPERSGERDCFLAAQNLMLAAHALGLGSCPVGLAIPPLASREIRERLGTPAGYEPVFAIALGYPDRPTLETTPASTRLPPRVLSWLRS